MQAEYIDPAGYRAGNFLVTYRCDDKYNTHVHKQLRWARFSFLTNINSITLELLMGGKKHGETCIIDLDALEVVDSFVSNADFRGKPGA